MGKPRVFIIRELYGIFVLKPESFEKGGRESHRMLTVGKESLRMTSKIEILSIRTLEIAAVFHKN